MRSYIAECVLFERAAERLGESCHVLEADSCGVEASDGMRPHPLAVWSLGLLGVAPRAVHATRVSGGIMESSDLVISMTRQQCYQLASAFAEQRTKCFSLIEINGAIETLLENSPPSPGTEEAAAGLLSLPPAELESSLRAAVAKLTGAPRDRLRPLPGVRLGVRELMMLFPTCFNQVSNIHDPLGGTEDEVAGCARLIGAEVTALVDGLLELAAVSLRDREA